MPASTPRPNVDVDTAHDTVCVLLRELVEEVRGLRHDIATAGRRSSTLSRADHQKLSVVLPAIAGALGSDEFTVAELLEHRAVRLVIGTLDVQAVGRLLYRGMGLAIDGYVVQRRGAELNRGKWRVVQTV